MEIVFCTNNQHKIEEVASILGNQFHFLKLNDIGYNLPIDEPFETIEENSAIKASTIFSFCQKNVFAEDTGLFIETLQGEPGVYSARYAGEPTDSKRNIEKVLKKLGNNPNRSAYFKTVITLIIQNKTFQFEGICPGKIAYIPTGNKGFGYDPIFIPNGYEQSFAELPAEIKNRISHRKLAFDKFICFLKNDLTNFKK